MQRLLEFRIGPFGALPLTIVLGLVAADVLWTLRIHRQLRSQEPDPPRGYALGLAFSVWHRTVLLTALGLFALSGSQLAFVVFSAGTVWRALGPGRVGAAGFLVGYEKSSGESHPALASAFGAGWVVMTRGIPLALLYASIHAV